MTGARTQSLTCPVMIGREVQRGQLLEQLEQARTGHGQLATVSGEAGIGKSRLVAEVTRQAAAAGFGVVQARCYETERSIPYGPLLGLIHHQLTLHSVAEMRAELGEAAGELGQLAPALRSSPATAISLNDPETDKQRLWRALLRLVADLPATTTGAPQPLHPRLLVFEDLHWCDEASLDFLTVLARQAAGRPLFLLMTHRPDDMTPPLARFLAALERDRLAGDYPLARLPEEQVEEMLRAIFGLARPPQADFRDALFQLTGGNPFFIEEVLKACVSEGTIFQLGDQWGRKPLNQLQIPRTVQLAVQQRVAQLTPAAQELLVLAAVAGQRWEFELLMRVSGQNERELIRLIKELIASQLVVEEAPDQFAFRHALTQHAVYSGLLARERRLYHRQIAETLEELAAGAPVPGSAATVDAAVTDGALARHFEAAGHWERCFHYAQRAGEQAQRLEAPRSAVEHYSRALNAAEQLGRPAPLALLQARGQCYELLGDFGAAQSDWEAVLAGAEHSGNPHSRWQALLNLGFLWTSRDFGRATDYYERALLLARTLDDPAALAHTLNRIGNWHVNMEDPHRGQRYHAEALLLFEGMDDLAGKAATLDLLAGAAHFGGNLPQSMAWYAEAAGLAHTLGDRRATASSLAWLAFRGPTALNQMVATAPLAACIRSGEEALAMTREIQWRPGSAFAMLGLAFAWAARGNYGQALALAQQAHAITQEIQHGWATVAGMVLGIIWMELGDHATAQRHLVQAMELARRWNIGFGIHNATSFLALSLVQQRHFDRAEATLAHLFGAPPVPDKDVAAAVFTLKQRIYWSVRCELALGRGNPAEALAIAELLVTRAEVEGASAPAETHVVPRLRWLRARALLATGQTTAAAGELATALSAAQALGAEPDCWRIHRLQGELARAQGRPGEAVKQVAAARAMIETLAATLPDVSQREHYLQYALAALPSSPALTPRQAAREQSGGLTAREQEIARCIAQGLSDQAIADALVLSKRTVSTHVSNILTKLDFSSRSQIAAWVAARDR